METNNYNYDIKKAASRLTWRFREESGDTKPFKPNEEDIKSLNTILEWINREKKEKLDQNVLFAKLYIYVLVDFTRKYKTTIFDKLATKEVNRLLDRPLETFYEAFKKELYSNQIDEALKQIKCVKTAKNISPDEFKEIYTLEFLTASLDHEITEALNRFSR